MNIACAEIESAFFEFQKMKAFLQAGVSVDVPGVPHAPIDKAQEYVNSLLLIDLISVFDKAVEFQFGLLRLKEVKDRSKFLILREAEQMTNPGQLWWYREWRHATAHNFERQDYSKLNQATEEVARQLAKWNFVSGTLNFWHHYREMPGGIRKIGSRVGEIPILEFEAWSNVVPSGQGASSRKTIDLSFEDFMNILKEGRNQK
jgi:hypothetical protein